MSDRDVIAALQRQAAEAEVERRRLVTQCDDLLAALKFLMDDDLIEAVLDDVQLRVVKAAIAKATT